ncbi:MAG: hypothetical protein GY852_10385 [bacterium]|nr:hypothetical protein [bacterium]
MKRAPVLLAMGRHGTKDDGSCQKGFFKKTVVPFMREQVSKRRNVFLIQELFIHEGGFKPFTPERRKQLLAEDEGAIHSIQKTLDSTKDKWDLMLRESIGKGIESEGAARIGITDWGYMEAILELNAERENSVIMVVEPPDARVLCKDMQRRDFDKKVMEEPTSWEMGDEMAGLRSMVERIGRSMHNTINVTVGRDSALVGLVKRIVAENPDPAIIVPRGSAHIGMEHLFDPEVFELTVIGSGLPKDFSQRAVYESYKRELQPQEIGEFALMQIELATEAMGAGFDVTTASAEERVERMGTILRKMGVE